MSLFKTILSKIFAGKDEPSSPTPPSRASTPVAGAVPDRVRDSDAGGSLGAAAGAAFGGSPSIPAAPAGSPGQSVSEIPATPSNPVDVAAVLDGLAAANPEKLDWKRSIVDLMKLLEMDGSLTSRKELAFELHYPGDTGDSAKMNIWLHQEVLRKLAENGGKVPADLLD